MLGWVDIGLKVDNLGLRIKHKSNHQSECLMGLYHCVGMWVKKCSHLSLNTGLIGEIPVAEIY